MVGLENRNAEIKEEKKKKKVPAGLRGVVSRGRVSLRDHVVCFVVDAGDRLKGFGVQILVDRVPMHDDVRVVLSRIGRSRLDGETDLFFGCIAQLSGPLHDFVLVEPSCVSNEEP